MARDPFSQGVLTDLVAAAHYYGGAYGREYVPRKRVIDFCAVWAARNGRLAPSDTEITDVIDGLREARGKYFQVSRGRFGGGRLLKFTETSLNRILHDDWLKAVQLRGSPWNNLKVFFPTFSGRKALGSFTCPDRIARISDTQEFYELKSWVSAGNELKKPEGLGSVLVQEITEYAKGCDRLNIALEVHADYFEAPYKRPMRLVKDEVDRQADLYKTLGIGFWLVAVNRRGKVHISDVLAPNEVTFKQTFAYAGRAGEKDKVFYEHWRPEWIETILKAMVEQEQISEESRRTYRSYISSFLGWRAESLGRHEEFGDKVTQSHLEELDRDSHRWAQDVDPAGPYLSGVSQIIQHAMKSYLT